MATEAMIDMAARGPSKPGVSKTFHGKAHALLWQASSPEDVEAAERSKAARSVVRLALGRHACPALAACPVHGRDVCGCAPCSDQRHQVDAESVLPALRLLGLAEDLPRTSRKCHACKKPKPLSAFTERATCDECCAVERDRRTAKRVAS